MADTTFEVEDELLSDSLSDDDFGADDLENIGSQAGGGDIDDEAPSDNGSWDLAASIKLRQEAEQAKTEAATKYHQWVAVREAKERELADAQAAHAKALSDALESNVSSAEGAKAVSAAMQRILDARSEVDRAAQYQGHYQSEYHRLDAIKPLSDAMSAWVDRNPRYANDERYRERVDRLRAQFKQSGRDPDHPETIRLIEQKLSNAGRLSPTGRRTPGAPAVHTDRRGERQPGQISKEHARFIALIGRNPNDARVRAQWNESWSKTQRVAQRGGRGR